MVELKNEQLNHFYKVNTNPTRIEIGDTTGLVNNDTIELYEKSLALMSELKRLPIIRSAEAIFGAADLFKLMDASAINGFTLTVQMFNGKKEITSFGDYTDEDMFFHKELTIQVNDSTAATNTSSISLVDGGFIPKASSILGKSEVTILTRLSADEVVAGAVFDPMGVPIIIEVDWIKASKNQIDDYIREAWFADTN